MAAKDLGPLDWKAPIVDTQGRPSPEFQRRWNLQRNNNALIGTITFGAGTPTGTPQDGAEYVNTATTPFTVFLGRGGAWHQAGAVAFTDLTDAPHAYATHGLALLRVKATADGVEFATQSAALDSLGAAANGQLLQRAAGLWALVTLSAVLDTISSTRGTVLFRGVAAWSALAPSTAGNVLTTAGPGADPSWTTPAGGGGFPVGTPPTIVQVAHATSSVAATFGVAPTAGNLLVAITFNSGGNTAQAGWTKFAEDAGGTDWGNVCTKIAGVGESTTQQAMGATTSGGTVIWELHKVSGTPALVGSSVSLQAATPSIPTSLQPCVKDCIGLSASAVIGTTVTFTTPVILGVQDVLDNTGNRRLLAVHSDLSLSPTVTAMSLLSAAGTSKTATGLIK